MKKRKWIIIGVVLAAVVGGGFAVRAAMGGSRPVQVNTTELAMSDLVDSINVKGIVESNRKRTVYSTVSGMLKEVNVVVGDQVEQGRTLAVIDTEELEMNIAQQKADLTASEQSNLNQLQNTERLFSEAAANLEGGKNSQLLNAESSLKTAESNLKTAQKNYNDALREYREGDYAQLISAESNRTSAKQSLDTTSDTHDKNLELFAAGAISEDALTQSENALVSAQNRYDDAVKSYDNAIAAQKKTLEQNENALRTAQINYNNAQALVEAAKTGADQDLERLMSNVESAKIAVNNESRVIAIQRLEKQLRDSTITAPIAGTVTAVYAKEGASGSGLLFVIEDTENLIVETRIKEYDIGRVRTEMPVIIKTDATGDMEFEGFVQKIEPAAVKTAAGDTATASDIEFKTTVTVTSKDEALKIGMNTRLNVILEKKDNVFRVPYDSIAVNENGESVVYVVTAESDGGNSRYIASQLVVTTGLETDFYVEINGEGLREGLQIVSDSSRVRDGARIAFGSSTGAARQTNDSELLIDRMRVG